MTTADPRVLRWWHQLHRIPETAFAEHSTSAYVADQLRALGFDVETGVGGTGVVGSLTRGTSGRAIGLRTELDALPITEDSGLQYASTHEGRMPACGHDGHMALVLGAAAAPQSRAAATAPCTAPGEGGTPLHSSDHRFNDDVLAAGVAFYVELVRQELRAG